MATVSLQTAFDEARRAIETGAADKAIGIAQHILTHFPRMIEGSRLLGEAYLNAGQPEEAAAAFTDVLDADPENVAAYYGRGLAQQSLDQRAAAITSFERALEIQPNLADLRTQLMRLYAETPGSAGQFRLSRAGLGRLYARGGMFSQAVDEFRAVLDAEPDRSDVQVALAEALWRDGQEDEALDYCRDVLEQQPDLIKPTVLQGYMLAANGQPEGDTLWRRAAEQDATMALARTLFDILPPIRIEEPVLPEFDEAEWRAQAARRAAQGDAAPAMPVTQTADDDMFADSWLSTAGTAAAASGVAQSYDAPPVAAQAVGSDDDDLLASLLGFADDEPVAQANASADTDAGDVQPFSMDDWDAPAAPAANAAPTLPASLDDLGMADEPAADAGSADFGAVKPFSFDDWDLDSADTAPAASTPPTADVHDHDTEPFGFDAADQPAAGAAVQPFSFEADDQSVDSVQPFALDADDQPGAGVRPFSLDDDGDDMGGVQPFALDDDLDVAPFSFDDDAADAPAASADAQSSDSGLGAVQPFSLNDWGLGDDAPGTQPSTFGGASQSDSDDLGDLKPFSLDELSLDSIDRGTSAHLSGPAQAEPEEPAAESPGFQWQEPAWRSQMKNTPRPEPGSESDESIFSKLVRNRQPEPGDADATPAPMDALPEDERFFSLDDETLRLDLEDIDQSASTAEFDDPTAADAPASAASPVVDASAPADDTLPTTAPETPAAEQAEPDAALPFSLDDLASSDDAFSWETPTADETTAQPQSDDDLVAFSLADLGLSDEELAALDEQPELASDTAEGPATTPFSLADLGLSEDEIAALDLGETADVGDSGDTDTLSEPAQPEASAEDAMPEPFSLAELGLSDEELGLLDASDVAAPQDQPSDTDAELAELFASLDDAPDADSTASDAGAPAPTMAALDEDAPVIAPFTFGMDETDADTNAEQTDASFAAADAAAEPTSAFDFGASTGEATGEEWRDLQSQLDVDVPATRTPDDFLQEATETDGDVQSVLDTMPDESATDESAEALPFSLADLGLDDEELGSFDQRTTDQGSDTTADQSATTDDDLFAALMGTETDAPLTAAGSENTFDAAAGAAQPSDTAADDSELFSWPENDSAASLGALDAGTGMAAPEATGTTETAEPAAEPADAAEYGEAGAAAPDGGMSDSVDAFASQTPEYPAPSVEPVAVAPAQPEPEPYVAPAAAAAPVAVPPAVAPTAGSNDRLGMFRAQLAANPDNDALRLAVARMNQSINDLGGAMEQYKALIKRGSLLDDVVEDIRDSIADSDDPAVLRRLHRVLGDAYMKQNLFTEAMEEYSWTSGRST